MNQPDIIFLVLDTQRADRLGCYGHRPAITPHLDQFAAEGALFEQAISPAQWTIPSHASMFTGLYPTAHGVTQSDQALGGDVAHLAEVLKAAGYDTIAFCNNPLVGVLNNGFKRGFNTFYNYGGAIPSLPQHSTSLPWPVNRWAEAYTQFLRRISYPIQNFFGQSDLAFRLSLSTWFTPLWSRLANFKGQNERSIRDVVHFLHERERNKGDRPLFLFINLMETHLPFWPPGHFVDQVMPYFRKHREARQIMSRWNREAYRWAVPLDEPLPELEQQVLSDMYDVEVAYQDHYLGGLFAVLSGRDKQANTLTVIVGDHGDGLGEHNHMGHSFVAYQELLHVPLLLHWPKRLAAGERIPTPVSTRRVYHTMLDAAGRQPKQPAPASLNLTDIHRLTLLHTLYGRDPEGGTAYAEVYPPLNLVKAVERRQPELIGRYRIDRLRRAVVKNDLKLIQVDEQAEELYHLAQDPLELANIRPEQPEAVQKLNSELNNIAANVERQRQTLTAGTTIDLEGDERLLQHLRSLGYLD